MSDNFFFNKTFHIKRKYQDGSTEDFSVSGMARMKSFMDQKNGNLPAAEILFIFAPDREILPGDNVIFDDKCCTIGKVEPICSLDGTLQAYRVESI